MNADKWFRPLPDEFQALETGFGTNVVIMVLLMIARHQDLEHLQTTIADDLALEEAQGILSLISALINLGEFTRNELLEIGTSLCGDLTSDLFEELLDQFEGQEPYRPKWFRKQGRYRLRHDRSLYTAVLDEAHRLG
jgi:hypothetical protein